MVTKISQLHKIKVIIFITCFIGIGLFLLHYSAHEAVLKINNFVIDIEVVDDVESRKLGLSGREKLCNECGMLFVFEDANIYQFWMNDMKFDIDIIWIEDNIVVDISKHVSHKTPGLIILPSVVVNSVLEVNSGYSDEFGIKIGQKIQIE